MNRLFSVARRRPHIVDLYTPFVYGVDFYRLKWAANFDGSFTQFIDSTNVGFLDSNVNRNALDTQPSTGKQVRITFDPTTYSITDSAHFWMLLVPVTGGSEGTPGAPTLVLPDTANHGVGIVTIHGAAPSATSVAGSLQLDLPRLMTDFRIHNEDTANYLFVATEAGGGEQQLRPDTFPQYSTFSGTHSSLYVRGATSGGTGAAVNFSATFTLAFPR